MTSWHMRGSMIELCNCLPGCDCNFRGAPNSPEGNCEAFGCHRVREGRYADIDLTGVTFAIAYWWPGAIHDKGGRAHAFVDCDGDGQFDALASIIRGEAGHEFFEIFNSTYEAAPTVERATIEATFVGKASSFRVEGAGRGQVEPLRNPVSGAENDVRIVKPGGFIWKDGAVAQSRHVSVDVPGISFEHAGRHAVLADFDWSV